MKKFVTVLALAALTSTAYAAVKIENVKVVITEKGKDPVTVVVPYWVAKAGSEVTDLVKIGEKDVDLRKLLTAMENAPKLGTIMTVDDQKSKIVISIE